MAQIPPIEDAYIDEIIKSAGPYDPTLNKTQGVKLRELVKLMRNRSEQQSADATPISRGILQLAGDLSGTADLPTVPGLVNKQNVKTIKVIPETAYTLLDTDTDCILHFTSAESTILNIPSGLLAGGRYEGKQLAAGQITFIGVGSTLRKGASENLKTAEQYSVFAVDWIASEEYMVYGKLELV